MAAVTYQKFANCGAQNNSDNLDIFVEDIHIVCVIQTLSGMMLFVHHGDHPGKASVMFLPIIDMNSSDTTCIICMWCHSIFESSILYSTLTEHVRRHDVSPIITFDQSLWWKALMIIRSETLVNDLRRIVLHWGGGLPCRDVLSWLYRTRYGFIWTTGTPVVDNIICPQHTGAYVEWEGHCTSSPCTFRS